MDNKNERNELVFTHTGGSLGVLAGIAGFGYCAYLCVNRLIQSNQESLEYGPGMDGLDIFFFIVLGIIALLAFFFVGASIGGGIGFVIDKTAEAIDSCRMQGSAPNEAQLG